jgi:hypothetical protein
MAEGIYLGVEGVEKNVCRWIFDVHAAIFV